MPDTTAIPFDVFLLYNHLEIDSVEPVYQALKDVRTYLDTYDLPPGANWREFEGAVLGQNPVVVLFLGSHGWGTSHRQLAIELQVSGKSAIIPVLLPGAPPEALKDARGVFEELKYVELDPRNPTSIRLFVARIRAMVSTRPAADPNDGSEQDEGPSPSQFIRLDITTRAVSDIAQADLLGFSDYAGALADLIKNEHTEKPITIGICAPWGMGKTRLMQMIQERLTRTSPDGKTTTLPTAWFDAWKYDREDSLWAALALEVLAQARRRIGWKEWIKVWTRLNWQRLDREALTRTGFNTVVFLILAAISLAMVYPILLSQWAAKEAVQYVKKAGVVALYGAVFKMGYEVLKRLAVPFDQKIARYVKRPDYAERVGFIGKFQEDFKKVVESITGTPANPLVIFIDDLDRCSPAKTAEVLEAINLLLDSERCVFVIGMDAGAVAASLEAKYKEVATLTRESDDPGGLTLGQRFLEKIFQIEFRLPPPAGEHMERYVDSILGADDKPPAAPEVDKQKVAAMKEEIAKGQEAGKSLEEAARAARVPGVSGPEVAEAKLESFAESFDSYPAVRDAVRSAATRLGNNPRKVKRFVNLFRLQALIANRRRLLESGVIRLDLLAEWLVAETRWPELMREFLDHPNLVSRAREARKAIDAYRRNRGAENHDRMTSLLEEHPFVKKLAEAEEALGVIEKLHHAAGDHLHDYLHLGRIAGEAKAQIAAAG
jgi:hypothetical protein